MTDLIRDHLVEGNTVAKTRPSRMRRGGQKRFVSAVSSIDAGVREPAEHSELLSMRRDLFEIRRQVIIPPRPLGKEMFGNEAEILVDGDHSLGRGHRGTSAEGFEHR